MKLTRILGVLSVLAFACKRTVNCEHEYVVLNRVMRGLEYYRADHGNYPEHLITLEKERCSCGALYCAELEDETGDLEFRYSREPYHGFEYKLEYVGRHFYATNTGSYQSPEMWRAVASAPHQH